MNDPNMAFGDLNTRVAKLERAVQFLLEHLELTYDESPAALFPDVTELKRLGKEMDAIKLYREKTDADLAEAKRFVNSL